MFSRTITNNNSLFLNKMRRLKSTLVMVEHKDGKLSSGTLNALSAASKFSHPVTCLLASTSASSPSVLGQLKSIKEVKKVLISHSEQFEQNVAESYAGLLKAVQTKHNFSVILAAHSAFGKAVLPRLAAQLDVGQLSDVVEIAEGGREFTRPIYAGNALAKVRAVSEDVKVLTVRTTAFPPVTIQASQNSDIEVEEIAAPPAFEATKWIKEETSKSDRPELGSAKRVISGGRGLKNGDNFKLLYELADTMGGAVGASRAAVDAGFVPNDLQIGQTGKIVAPDLYVAVGISGAIQHLAGMKDSKVIVAINKDAEAPIFQVADYGLVEDLFKAVPELTQKLKK